MSTIQNLLTAKGWIIVHDYKKPNPLDDVFLRFSLLSSVEQKWLDMYYPVGKGYEYSKRIPENEYNQNILNKISEKLNFFPRVYTDISTQTFQFIPET